MQLRLRGYQERPRGLGRGKGEATTVRELSGVLWAPARGSHALRGYQLRTWPVAAPVDPLRVSSGVLVLTWPNRPREAVSPGRALSGPLSLHLSTHRNLAFSRRSGRQVHEEIEAKEGLPSADRNNKATLLLTGPFRTSKSSAKDLTPLVLKLQFAKYHYSLREQWRNRLLRR